MVDGSKGEGVGAVVVVGPGPNREFESELSEDHLRFMAPLLSVSEPPPPLTSQSSVTQKQQNISQDVIHNSNCYYIGMKLLQSEFNVYKLNMNHPPKI